MKIPHYKLLLFVLLIIASNACTTIENPKVEIYGALFEMMHQGNLSTRIDLNSLKGKKHTYGLGALTDLKGEILIMDSNVFISSETNNGDINISNSYNHQAALFVQSQVSKWQSIELPSFVHTVTKLEDYIESEAERYGLDIEKPFPFIISGVIPDVKWHIINWPEGDTEHSHTKHINSGLSGHLKDTSMKILGFYSKHHKAIFTHHTTNVHMHFLTNDKKISGHIDEISFDGNQQLFFPN